MKTLIVIFAALISSTAFAQTAPTEAEILKAQAYLKKSNWNSINKGVTPVYTNKSILAIRDSLNKKKISSTLSQVEFLGSEINPDRLVSLNCDTRMKTNKVPFSFFKIIKKKHSFVIVEICGSSDL
jgi:hypothetical protein